MADIIINGRTVHDSTYKNGETIRVEEGGLLRRATLKPATLYVSSGGVVGDRVVVKAGGIMHVSSGGLVSGSTQSEDPEKPLDNYAQIGSGGVMYVSNGGLVSNCLVDSNSVAYLLSGGVASDTVVESGVFHISSGARANNTIVASWGALHVYNGGVVNGGSASVVAEVHVKKGGYLSDFVVNTLGTLNVSGGGVVNNVTALGPIGGGQINVLGGTVAGAVLEGGFMDVSSGGVARHTNIEDGALKLYSGGFTDWTTVTDGMIEVHGGVASNTTAEVDGVIRLSGGVAYDNFVTDGGQMIIGPNGVASRSWIAADGSMGIASGGVHRGSLYIDSDARVTVANGGAVDFNVAEARVNDDFVVNDISLIELHGGTATKNTAFVVTVPWMTTGDYYLAGGTVSDILTLTVKTPDGAVVGKFNEGSTIDVGTDGAHVFCYLDNFGDGYFLNFDPTIGTGNAYGVAVSAGEGIIAYTKGNGYLIVGLEESQSMVNTYGLAGNYQWEWYGEGYLAGNVTGKAVSSPQYYKAYENNNTDLFFANAKGVWEGGYTAKHVGFPGREGTGDSVNLAGKNKIVDVFVGAYSYAQAFGEASILVLTDDANGDALFLDDIYSAIPTATQQGRLDNIMEIRAGAGDDVVDLTSQRFDFDSQSNGVRVYGGDGNDTIWANYGNNELYGDAGNDHIVGGNGDDYIIGGAGDDTMHGFGGSDTFFFGSNWGNDVVEQFSDGEVTLWFKNGSSENWDAAAMKYTDGLCSVTVIGITADDVTLKFGDAQSAAPAGAFDDSATKKVYETSFFA